MMESAESKHPRLTNCEWNYFQRIQPMWSPYLSVTDGRTDVLP